MDHYGQFKVTTVNISNALDWKAAEYKLFQNERHKYRFCKNMWIYVD